MEAFALGEPRCLDGDTIILYRTHIRPGSNIDAPEIPEYQRDAELRLGLIAKWRMGRTRPFSIYLVDPASRGWTTATGACWQVSRSKGAEVLALDGQAPGLLIASLSLAAF